MSKIKIIVVSVIVTIIVGITLLLYISSESTKRLEKAREQSNTMRISYDLKNISKALENYYKDNGKYPTSLETLLPMYIPEIPVERSTGKSYGYFLDDSQNYRLCPQNLSPEAVSMIFNKGETCWRNDPPMLK